MKCPNCYHEAWESVDWARFKEKKEDGSEQGMHICTSCGFVTYPSKWDTKENILEHYRKDYRKPPTVSNLFTGQRKNHFHIAFLKDQIKKWNESEQKPLICEIGAAFGMSLHMLTQVIPGCEVYGTEITESYKRVAWHEFKLDLVDDFDDTKKHDMIMSYKVLEHQLDPHKELLRYAKALKEDGVLYMSVPTWFGPMVNFGLDGFDLEYYYDPNHINMWTVEMFESMLDRAGFDIIKKDHGMYGDTYLCKVSKDKKSSIVHKEDYLEIKNRMRLIKNAATLFMEQKYEDAIAVWPNFPSAQIANAEMKRKLLAERGWTWFEQNIILPLLKSCPNSVDAIVLATDFAMRVRNWQEAMRYAQMGLDMKPNNSSSMVQVINIYDQMSLHEKDEAKKVQILKQCRDACHHLMQVSEANKFEMVSKIYFLNSKIPKE
jgi:SAM-dependent methyltransferase